MMKSGRYATATAFAIANRQKGNYFPPTTTVTAASQFPRFNRRPCSVTSLVLSLWLVVLLWVSPRYVRGLPLVMRNGESQRSAQDVILDLRGGYVTPQQWWHWHLRQNENRLVGAGDEADENDNVQDLNYGDDEQEATGLEDTPNENVQMMMVPTRGKKGLSYLTKYYSEAFLNNTPNSGGGGASSGAQSHHPDSSNQFFGVGLGMGSSASGEHRFPSSVRRKLSFYPPMTSHSGFMAPWSRSSTGTASSGRTSSMRLRWGK